LSAESVQIAVLLAQDGRVLAIGRGCGARDKDGHHAEVSIKAGFLGTECRIACLVKVLDGTRDAAGDDPLVEGRRGGTSLGSR
jgi:hypothetical protein